MVRASDAGVYGQPHDFGVNAKRWGHDLSRLDMARSG